MDWWTGGQRRDETVAGDADGGCKAVVRGPKVVMGYQFARRVGLHDLVENRSLAHNCPVQPDSLQGDTDVVGEHERQTAPER